MKKYQQILLKTILTTFRHLPFSVVCRSGDLIGILLYHILKERREIGLSNLRIAFPEKTPEERRAIFKKCWRNISKDLLEVLKYFCTPPDLIKEKVSISGIENLNYCLAKNKGVIALSAHYGNFPLLLHRLVLEKYGLAVITARIHNKIFNPMFPYLQREAGLKPIPDNPRHRCVALSLAWLKKGGILFLQIDQNPSEEAGVPVDFFGKNIPTFRGPLILAMRTGASILPMFIMRKENNHHQIVIEKPFELNLTGDNEKDIRDNLQALSKITEEYIRRYPSMWWWIHRRFRMAIPD
ncbi:MAG: hypothetical protein WC560_04710 [Syntrophales bacterium]